jgi:hypothetical protein
VRWKLLGAWFVALDRMDGMVQHDLAAAMRGRFRPEGRSAPMIMEEAPHRRVELVRGFDVADMPCLS